MLFPTEELKLLYMRAIRDVAWEDVSEVTQTSAYQVALRFKALDGRREFILSFDSVNSPEIMALQAQLPFARGMHGMEPARRLAVRLNAETPGVKFFLVEAPTPLLICSIEAILAAHRRIPNSEVVDAVLRNALQRLEEALEQTRRELRAISRD
jgi:hypothetical protein